jgi:6-phosphogluconolactonase
MINIVYEKVIDAIDNKASSIILTGGRSAKQLYNMFATVQVIRDFSKINLYFSDERCVPPEYEESNYRTVVDTLFSGEAPGNLMRIQGEANDPQTEAARYATTIPDEVDLLLLSVGEDGHIASLFPGNEAIDSLEKVVFVKNVPKPPFRRITITPSVIQSAQEVIVMASGPQKGEVLAKALKDPLNIMELPVRLTIGRMWILDEAASLAFKRYVLYDFYNTKIIYA